MNTPVNTPGNTLSAPATPAVPPTAPLLSVRDLKVHFPVQLAGGLFGKKATLKAVDGISFDLHAGETLGVVGESGCGKSTLGRAILRLLPLGTGVVSFLGRDLLATEKRDLRAVRNDLQVVFQDPLASLNPRMTAGAIIAEPLRNFHPELTRKQVREQVQDMMAAVGLLPQMINRYPHEFSGGQCQRIGIARAMILRPRLVVCDEPVSALDVSIQAQVINLLGKLKRELNLSLLFISHDLSVVRHISDRVMVLYLGKVMELGDSETLYADPRHPYTRALISAIPVPDPRVERTRTRMDLKPDLPSPVDPPSGCVFRTRCPLATDQCATDIPALLPPGADTTRVSACHYRTDLDPFAPPGAA